jgi:hypothetical protein
VIHPGFRGRILVPVLLVVLAAGCAPPADTRFDAAQTTKGKSAVSKEAHEGKDFNKFFPKEHAKAPWDFVFKQDKKDAAIADLKKDGKLVATLSITDTLSEPEARDKFKESTEKVAGYPAAEEGKHGSALLVNDRYQVKIRSAPEGGLSKEEREEWLAKFDLDGLSKLD